MKGEKLIVWLLAVSLFSYPAFAAWQPPVGIPAPSFGIDEQAPLAPSPWSTNTAAFYYIEQSNPSCSDTNAYGYPASPRCTIPSSLPAGAVVELHGTYTVSHRSPPLALSGTASKPV